MRGHLIQPPFVFDFPNRGLAALETARGRPDTVERFELYIGGFEVANAFSELKRSRGAAPTLRAAAGRRQGGDQEAHEMDEDYVRALEYGLPPTAGEVVGVDRLVMLLTDSPQSAMSSCSP